MIKEWDEIQKEYAERIAKIPQYSALNGVMDVVNYIMKGHLKQSLNAWTSMFDLCIVQSRVSYPYDGPMLRVAPLQNGEIIFRYEDTPITAKHWQRTIPSDQAVVRFQKFLDQLHWEIVETKR